MAPTTQDTKTVNGLMAVFYDGAKRRNAVHVIPQGEGFTLTAKQFDWLCNVAHREDGFIARNGSGRATIQGEISGVGGFDVNEQRYGSATVIVRS
jgi:hypothetical protein